MIVSFSEVMKYDTCIRQFYYGFILKLAPLSEKDSIDVGVKGHKLLQRFYELTRDGIAKDEAINLVRKFAGLDVDFNMLKAWTLVDNYIRDNDFTNVSLHIEEQFKIPVSKLYTANFTDIPDDLEWSIGFTPDLVQVRKGNFVDVEDYKFVQKMWPQAKINRFPQVKLYKIFLTELEYNVSRCILRLFNVTTGEAKLKVYTPTKAEEGILLRDFLTSAYEVYKFKKLAAEKQNLAPRTMNYFTCQYCSFAMPCQLEAEGKDATKTLHHMYKVRDYGYS